MNQDKDTAGSTSDSFSKDRSLKSEATVGKGKLAELAETAASAGKAQLDSGLGQAAGQVEQVAKVIDDTAARLKQENQEGLAAYATQVAGSIESVANRLRHSSVDELATEARQLARSNPVMFLLGSVAIGFGMTRFLKASSRISDVEDFGYRDASGSYGDSRTPTRDWQSSSTGSAQGAWSSGNGSTGNPGSSNGSSSTGSPTSWDRASGTTGGTSGGMGASAGSGSSSGLGGSSGLGSGPGTGASSGLGASSSLGGSTGSGTASSGTRSGTDSLDELRAKPMFPEMKTDGLKPGGTVGGSRTNEIGGGSHG